MLKGDVRLGTHVGELGVSSRASAQDLDQDGLGGSAEGLHRLLMGGLGELFAIDLEETGRNTASTSPVPAAWSVPADPERTFQGASRRRWPRPGRRGPG